MKEIDVHELKDNFFDAISKEWMLVTAGKMSDFNMMTASWGCIGWLWARPVAVVFIRPERFTHEFVERNDVLTLSFLGDSADARAIYNFCGTKSGRDFNKVAETGLIPVETADGNVTFEQARLTVECRKLYKDCIKEANFLDKEMLQYYGGQRGGFHDVYVLEIMNVYVQ